MSKFIKYMTTRQPGQKSFRFAWMNRTKVKYIVWLSLGFMLNAAALSHEQWNDPNFIIPYMDARTLVT